MQIRDKCMIKEESGIYSTFEEFFDYYPDYRKYFKTGRYPKDYSGEWNVIAKGIKHPSWNEENPRCEEYVGNYLALIERNNEVYLWNDSALWYRSNMPLKMNELWSENYDEKLRRKMFAEYVADYDDDQGRCV